MEGLIHHFKLFTEGYTLPEGEVYTAVSSTRRANSVFTWFPTAPTSPTGSRYVPPGSPISPAMNEMAQGHMLADVVAIIGTQDIVFGEIDR